MSIKPIEEAGKQIIESGFDELVEGFSGNKKPEKNQEKSPEGKGKQDSFTSKGKPKLPDFPKKKWSHGLWPHGFWKGPSEYGLTQNKKGVPQKPVGEPAISHKQPVASSDKSKKKARYKEKYEEAIATVKYFIAEGDLSPPGLSDIANYGWLADVDPSAIEDQYAQIEDLIAQAREEKIQKLEKVMAQANYEHMVAETKYGLTLDVDHDLEENLDIIRRLGEAAEVDSSAVEGQIYQIKDLYTKVHEVGLSEEYLQKLSDDALDTSFRAMGISGELRDLEGLVVEIDL